MPIVTAPTVTKLGADARGAVLVTGSHGGVYPGGLAAKAQVRAVIFHDAGLGRGDAGIGALTLLAKLGIAAAAVSHMSARVGDTEDMLARVSRSENESSEATRRIEEQLRSVARRLDSAERSQSENNRAMSKTASEINIATREQSQAFDQLGTHVMSLSDRMERLERSAAQDGLKDAVKALHQGLSRVADQITQSATQSATQVSSLTGNMEQLANRVGQVRTDIENTTQALEQRLGSVEKAAQFTTNALDHALEKLEAQHIAVEGPAD